MSDSHSAWKEPPRRFQVFRTRPNFASPCIPWMMGYARLTVRTWENSQWRLTDQPAFPHSPSRIRALPAQRPETRLHFPLLVEAGGGIYRLRCNIYFRHVLIQSQTIRARVARSLQELKGLDSELTYSVAPTLDVSALKNMSPHQLSILLSDDTDADVTFGFFARATNAADKEIGSEIGDEAGDEIVKHQTSFDAFQLQEAISRPRRPSPCCVG